MFPDMPFQFWTNTWFADLDRSIYFPISRGRPVDVVNHLCGKTLYVYVCLFITSSSAFKSNYLFVECCLLQKCFSSNEDTFPLSRIWNYTLNVEKWIGLRKLMLQYILLRHRTVFQNLHFIFIQKRKTLEETVGTKELWLHLEVRRCKHWTLGLYLWWKLG